MKYKKIKKKLIKFVCKNIYNWSSADSYDPDDIKKDLSKYFDKNIMPELNNQYNDGVSDGFNDGLYKGWMGDDL